MGITLNLVVEGPTEETFANRVLRDYLALKEIWVSARSVTTGIKKGRVFKGGVLKYDHCRRDIIQWLKQDRRENVHFSCLFDLYGLPDDFPGYYEAQKIRDAYEKVGLLEQCLGDDIGDSRFIPHFQLHEFETLLFCDPRQLSAEFDVAESDVKNLVDVAEHFGNPELINDSPHTAPSKRIIAAIPEYKGSKVSSGPIVAQQIGLPRLRTNCRHFGQWIDRLESLN